MSRPALGQSVPVPPIRLTAAALTSTVGMWVSQWAAPVAARGSGRRT
jgi:hypothetical protein